MTKPSVDIMAAAINRNCRHRQVEIPFPVRILLSVLVAIFRAVEARLTLFESLCTIKMDSFGTCDEVFDERV